MDKGDVRIKKINLSEKIQEVIPTNEINCRLHSITSERIGNPELKAAIKCVHEYNNNSAILIRKRIRYDKGRFKGANK